MQHRIKQPYSISVKNLLTFQTFIWIFPCKHLCIDTLKREVLSIMIVVTELKKKQSKRCYVKSFPCTGLFGEEIMQIHIGKSWQNFCSIPQKWERESPGSPAAGL